MSKADPRVVAAVMSQIDAALGESARRPVVIGLCGAQGSGKTTLARAVLASCTGKGLRAAALSIDDIYLTRAERAELARSVHPLLATRGVPGTHDVGLGLRVMDALERGEAARLPRFDKARDDRAAMSEWPSAPEACEVLIFEGWCVGAAPQREEDLAAPVNGLEEREDADGRWRRYVNAAMAGRYASLFARLDRLVLIAAPDFAVVYAWRLEQERDLARSAPSGGALMDEAGISRFISHYERLTRHILQEMPARADLVILLDEQRRPVCIESGQSA
ncbi:kinase [Novosphingobium pentaromativorans]|uniref:Kinase-like protein n=1 Tax=Novosphingobium pentaromativorans US6-1 TaxID=1088721 RepID=G6E6P8_9SPHN|nr:kinase-like protein [Novosphingobium pentaromativorans US6-1]